LLFIISITISISNSINDLFNVKVN